jgi:hypothetical protein
LITGGRRAHETVPVSAFNGAAALAAVLIPAMTAGDAQAQQATKPFFEGDLVRPPCQVRPSPPCILVKR